MKSSFMNEKERNDRLMVLEDFEVKFIFLAVNGNFLG